jgi:hypothetical protein
VQNRISPGREHVPKKLFAASVRNLIKEFEPASAIYEFAVVISPRKHRIVQIFRFFLMGQVKVGPTFMLRFFSNAVSLWRSRSHRVESLMKLFVS